MWRIEGVLIDDLETAKYVSQFVLGINDQLDESIRVVERGTSQAEYGDYKKGVGHVMYDVFDKLHDPGVQRAVADEQLLRVRRSRSQQCQIRLTAFFLDIRSYQGYTRFNSFHFWRLGHRGCWKFEETDTGAKWSTPRR